MLGTYQMDTKYTDFSVAFKSVHHCYLIHTLKVHITFVILLLNAKKCHWHSCHPHQPFKSKDGPNQMCQGYSPTGHSPKIILSSPTASIHHNPVHFLNIFETICCTFSNNLSHLIAHIIFIPCLSPSIHSS